MIQVEHCVKVETLNGINPIWIWSILRIIISESIPDSAVIA